MSLGSLLPAHRFAVVGLLATFAVAGLNWDSAQARAPRHDAKPAKHAKHAKKDTKHRVVHGPNYRPPYAAIVVDANSDQVLHEVSPDAPRHPASLTKIMTLYLLFEQIEAGKLKLDTPLQISAHAALQTPTKLGLKANQTISVEDAIKGLVTKSANDAAAVVGESIGGTEGEFARLMTEKARALGMANTTYVNASGLPAEEQITTARDQAILGRAIQDRFPVFYRYFSTPSFRYRGVDMRNHNSLLGQVKGVDGIKTGYTEASGYNLVSSVRRDERHIIGVVLGGTSNAARDTRMRQLIEEHIAHASTRRTAPAVVETAGRDDARVNAPVEKVGPVIPTPSPRVAPSGSVEPTLASVNADQSQASKPQTQASKPQTRSRRTTSKAATINAGAATPISAVAHDPKGSW
jgi:D-alanyl-D-alanine carboxypeptidase